MGLPLLISLEEGMWNAFILAFVMTVAVGDARWRKIPRWLTTAGFLAGLAYHSFFGGFWSALGTAGLAFGLGLGLYELRAIGGGDVKLITALGALLGFQHWTLAVEVAVVVAGVMALIGVIRRGVFLQTFRNIGRLLKHFASNGLFAHPEIRVQNEGLVRIPFGVAAAIGTICTVVMR
jgi:prepilin peptidase CpaA